MLYYGTEQEYAEAIKLLKEISGKDYKSKKEWLKYYRESNYVYNLD